MTRQSAVSDSSAARDLLPSSGQIVYCQRWEPFNAHLEDDYRVRNLEKTSFEASKKCPGALLSFRQQLTCKTLDRSRLAKYKHT